VKNKTALVVSLILGLFFVLIISSLENKKSNSLINKKPQQENNFVVERNNKIDESKIYEMAYQKGYNSFMRQVGRPDLVHNGNNNEKIEMYTSNIIEEASEEEKQKIEEISAKAYVDGYHKAGDSTVCPRFKDIRHN
jgi:hypothetical protein